jgi:hypothetical protein
VSVVAAAIIGSAVVGGVSASKSASKQAKAVERSTDAQVAESQRQYDQTREDFAPYREWGIEGMEMLNDPLANFQASPDYQFRRDEGFRDIGNQFAARGGGGNALRALSEFSSNLAGGEYGNWYARMMNKVGIGAGANNAMTAANAASSNQIANAYGNQGAMNAGIYANKYANINNAAQSGISNFLYAKQAGLV